MSQRLTTAGLTLSYAVEGTAGTRPTLASAYTAIAEVKDIPSLNPTPEAIESTSLDQTEYKTYEAGLKDLGGVLEFTANLTADLLTAWNTTLITASETGAAANPSKATWFCVQHPSLANAVYFKGKPVAIGLNEAAVNAMLETTLYIAPQSAPEWAAKPSST